MDLIPNTDKWTLHIGIHRGTMSSRDSEIPKELDSLAECRKHALEAFKEYWSWGCQCWFCYVITPEGDKISLLTSQPYK